MQISFEELRAILKSTGINVYRDEAPIKAKYPYIIYEFVNEQHKRVSNKVMSDMPLYQITYITNGTESELLTLKQVLNSNSISYSSFTALPYDENDKRVTQFNTYIRCVNNE